MGASVGVIAYMIFGGLGAPIVRAGMMFFFFNAMKSIEIESDFLDGIAISALILLTLDPTSIYSPSFLLSYTAIAGIAVWTKPLAKRMRLHGFFRRHYGFDRRPQRLRPRRLSCISFMVSALLRRLRT